jgi:hypothetical protein
MKSPVIRFVPVFVAIALPLAAQLQVNLDHLASKAKETVDINLDSSTMQMAANFLSGQDEAEVKKLTSKMKTLLVKSFTFEKDGEYRQDELQPIRIQLRVPGWAKILDVKDSDETVEIYTKSEQGRITGFALLAAEPKELTVIYIEGSLDLGDLGALKSLGVPPVSQDHQKSKKEPKRESKKGK